MSDLPLSTRVFVVERNPDQGVLLPTLASLLVPGLGQVLLGQYLKAVWVFFFCLPLVMLCGVGNVMAAGDAYAVATALREQDVSRHHTSWWLIAPVWAFRIGRSVLRLARMMRD